jgi:prevent-host-death family protein
VASRVKLRRRSPAPMSRLHLALARLCLNVVGMPAFNVRDAKTHLSKLLGRVLEGEEVLITRNGVPVAELVPACRRPFPLGAGRNDPNINREALASDDWWRPMTDEEAEAFLDGQH